MTFHTMRRSLEQELALTGMVVVLWRARARCLRMRKFEVAAVTEHMNRIRGNLPGEMQEGLDAAADDPALTTRALPPQYDAAMLWALTNVAVALPLLSVEQRQPVRREPEQREIIAEVGVMLSR